MRDREERAATPGLEVGFVFGFDVGETHGYINRRGYLTSQPTDISSFQGFFNGFNNFDVFQ